MREVKYLSPTSIDLFYKDTQEFYLRYLADNRPPRFPQTQPMSVGSAFDAYIKSYLYETLFGNVTPEFELDTLFEAQVEEQNRDWARDAGKYCFEQYKDHGALADLMIELEQATEDPRFEFTVEGRVNHEANIDGVTLLGKPDVYFHTKEGGAVVYDWKVNGFCSRSNTSPAKGYINLRPGGKIHPKAFPAPKNGLMINSAMTLDEVNDSWATQTAIYAWLLGEEVGGEFIVGIDQLACGAAGNPYPEIRVAKHRCLIAKDFQLEVYNKAVHVWEVIKSGHIFRELTKEASLSRQSMLDQTHAAYDQGDSAEEQWFQDKTRSW